MKFSLRFDFVKSENSIHLELTDLRIRCRILRHPSLLRSLDALASSCVTTFGGIILGTS